MTEHNSTLTVGIVFLAVLAVGSLSIVGPAIGATDTGETTENAQFQEKSVATTTMGEPMIKDDSAIGAIGSDAVNASIRNFSEANRSLVNASDDLDSVSNTIDGSDEYNESNHNNAKQTLREMDRSTADLNQAANHSVIAVNKSADTPAQKFLALQALENHRAAGEQRASRSVGKYQRTVNAQQASSMSIVYVRLGGGLLVGLLVGGLLGAIIPFREAQNVEDQLKLSRNVSYNRRAGLIPALVGLVLLGCGIGLLHLVGIINLLGVLI